jgi:NDP-sugar pyrophosphorylase family protein
LEVRAVPVVAWDMNLTYIGDLVACCRRRLAALGIPSLTGEGCRVAPGTELVETVLGDGVELRRPARLERCVVMPGAVLDDGAGLSDMVITRTARLQA